METASRKRVTHSEFSWVLEDNHLMRSASEKMGARVYKTYRVYDYPLNV
jgi:hypothetical protein